MLSKEKGSELLTQIGLTKIQAKIYLTLLSLDEANARTLTRETNVPRQEVYRALDDLQKKGFIEKIIASPHKFKATPIDYALQILMIKHTQQCKETQALCFVSVASSHECSRALKVNASTPTPTGNPIPSTISNPVT